MDTLFLGIGISLAVLQNLFVRTEQVHFAEMQNGCSQSVSFPIERPFYEWRQGIWILGKTTLGEISRSR